MQVDCSPWHREPLPRSWKYVSRSRGHSNRTCNATECLSVPMFDAIVVTSARNCPCHVCRLSQINRIHQNLSILSNDPLILTTSTKSLLWSSFFSSSFAKCWDCFRELQNTMTLQSGLSWRNSATMTKPFETNWDFLEQMSIFIEISCCRKSSGEPRTTQSPIDISTVNNVDNNALYVVGNVAVNAMSRGRRSLGWLPYTFLKNSIRSARISSQNDVPCCTWIWASSIAMMHNVRLCAQEMKTLRAVGGYIIA